ncbi:MAG: methyltransferase [Chitinivibrionales bacterium]|nr:methyltransferase [Chitinivibrionales bacterium]
MKLRIVAGKYRGRYITAKGQSEKFRPTLERNRRAVADTLQPFLAGARVGDFCAGCGAMGFEFLSRGAKEVVFVENNRSRVQCIRDQCRKWDIQGSCRIISSDIRSFVKKCPDRFGVIYFDPPYDSEELASLVPEIMSLLHPEGILVYERRRMKGEKKSTQTREKNLIKRKISGDSVMEFYKNNNMSLFEEQ